MTTYDMDAVTRVTQPLPRRGADRDVANAVLYLASDRSAQITGVVLPVDGGDDGRTSPVPGEADARSVVAGARLSRRASPEQVERVELPRLDPHPETACAPRVAWRAARYPNTMVLAMLAPGPR